MLVDCTACARQAILVVFLANSVVCALSSSSSACRSLAFDFQFCHHNFFYNQSFDADRLPRLRQNSKHVALFKQLQAVCNSSHLNAFVCAYFAPECAGQEEVGQAGSEIDRIMPCKELCRNAKFDCHWLLKKWKHEWPSALSCVHFKAQKSRDCLMKPQIRDANKAHVTTHVMLQDQRTGDEYQGISLNQMEISAPGRSRSYQNQDYTSRGGHSLLNPHEFKTWSAAQHQQQQHHSNSPLVDLRHSAPGMKINQLNANVRNGFNDISSAKTLSQLERNLQSMEITVRELLHWIGNGKRLVERLSSDMNQIQ